MEYVIKEHSLTNLANKQTRTVTGRAVGEVLAVRRLGPGIVAIDHRPSGSRLLTTRWVKHAVRIAQTLDRMEQRGVLGDGWCAVDAVCVLTSIPAQTLSWLKAVQRSREWITEEKLNEA